MMPLGRIFAVIALLMLVVMNIAMASPAHAALTPAPAASAMSTTAMTTTSMTTAAMKTASVAMPAMGMGHDLPCPKPAKFNCEMCCAVVPSQSAPIAAAMLFAATRMPALIAGQVGRALRPALPPPRLLSSEA